MAQASLMSRITQNPGQCGGRPCIRGMRIRVSDILEMLAENVSSAEILEDFPDLELEAHSKDAINRRLYKGLIIVKTAINRVSLFS